MKILITGCAGFIGSHLAENLLLNNLFEEVIGLDNLDPYYEISKKENNLKLLNKFPNFTFLKEDIVTTKALEKYKPEIICHLASLAGVRNSLIYPRRYCKVNIEGMINLLEQARKYKPINFVFASSSSVYGTNQKIPFEETDKIENINSPYAASKKAMEVYAKLYHKLYDLNVIGLRFFTVYGPRGRPDMAPYKFMNAIKNDLEITKYGKGDSFRDYTYVSDIVQGIVGAINSRKGGFEVYNLGNGNPITLNEFISTCEKVSKKKAKIKEIENQQGDVPGTYACIKKAKNDLGYNPKVKLKEGLKNVLCIETEYYENESKKKYPKVRDYGGYSIQVTEWCILGDCMQPECHHCYPVKECEKHELCKEEGTCDFIKI